MRNKITILLATLLLLTPALALADEASELKKKIFMDQKKLVVMENMEFTEQEAQQFWPVYEKHQEKLFKSSLQLVNVIASYASVYKEMKNDEALALLDEFQQAQKQRLDILHQYATDLKKNLPGTKVMRSLQVEYKLQAIARFEMAKNIPLAQ
jgi:hypothetical protein